MASNVFIDILRIKELRDRLLFTLGVLVVFRIGTIVPIPGVDVSQLRSYFHNPNQNTNIELFLDFFSGGAFSNFSVFMLGIMPYISMSIIMQLVLLVFPRLKKLAEEEGGKKKVQRWTRNGTVLVCIIQALTTFVYAKSQFPQAILVGDVAFILIAVGATTTGTLFLMWMGEQINQRGIGNGISLIIFAGIVARMPRAITILMEQIQQGELNPIYVLIALALFVVVIVMVIYEQRGQRKIPVNYAKRVVGRKMYGGQSSYLPFKINPSGVIPVIFASAIITLPIQLGQMLGPQVRWLSDMANFLRPGGVPYLTLYTLLIIFFAFFYTQVSLNPIEISRQIRENGGSIPGIRSEKTEEYLTRVLNRIVLPGSLFLAFIALIPTIVQTAFKFPPQVAYLMGGTSLLIIVGVDLDLMAQIEGQLRMHNHEGLVKKGRIRGRNL
jgi:preprotein translocase subunit SecY